MLGDSEFGRGMFLSSASGQPAADLSAPEGKGMALRIYDAGQPLASIGAVRQGMFWRAHPEWTHLATYATVMLAAVVLLGTIGRRVPVRHLRSGFWLTFLVIGGLIGKEEKAKTYGAAHVFVGCVYLVICGFAAYGLWGR